MRNLGMLAALVVAYVLLLGHPEGWHVALRSGLAVLVLGLGVLGWVGRQRSTGRELRPRRLPGWKSFAWLGCGVLSVEILLWGFLDQMPQHLESMAADFEAWLRPIAAEQRKRDAGAKGGPGSGHWLLDNAQRRELPRRADLKPGNRPEVFVQPLEGGESLLDRRLYVQAFALGRYEDGVWSVDTDSPWELQAGDDGWVRFGKGSEAPEISARVFHGAGSRGRAPVTGLQGLAGARIDRLVEMEPGFFLLPEKEEGEIGFEYDTVSHPLVIDDLAESDVKPPAVAPEHLLEMPGGSVGSRLVELSRVAQGEGSTVERLLRIRNHLRTTLNYSLVVENPADRDPLENFMFYEQQGHCEFFATAGALLARSAGVPSRICYGWTGGTYYENSGYFVFRSREAHAWAEVLLEGQGWVVFDPTPPAGLMASLPEVAGPEEKPPGLDQAELEDASAAGGGGWIVALVLLAGLPVVLLVAYRSFGPKGRTPVRQRVVAKPKAGSYREVFLSGCRKRGLRVRPGSTLRSLIDELEEDPGFLEELRSYHYSVSYEDRRSDPETETRLRRVVSEWTESA